MEKLEKEDISQEILYKLGMFEKNLELLNQQLQLVEKRLIDLTSLDFGMDEIKNSVGKEILAQLGRGIFVKAKIISDELIVDVGSKNLVKKSIPETKRILKEQVEKLTQIKKELEDEVEKIDNEMVQLVMGLQNN